MSDDTLTRRKQLISFDTKLLNIDEIGQGDGGLGLKSELGLDEDNSNHNQTPLDKLLSHSKWSRKLSIYQKLDSQLSSSDISVV